MSTEFRKQAIERGKEDGEGGEASQKESLLEMAGHCTGNMSVIVQDRHSQRC